MMISKLITLVTVAGLAGLSAALPAPTPISINSIRVGAVDPTAAPKIPEKDAPPPVPTLTPVATTTWTYDKVDSLENGESTTYPTTVTQNVVVQTFSNYVDANAGACTPPWCTKGPYTTYATTATFLYDVTAAATAMPDPYTQTHFAA